MCKFTGRYFSLRLPWSMVMLSSTKPNIHNIIFEIKIILSKLVCRLTQL